MPQNGCFTLDFLNDRHLNPLTREPWTKMQHQGELSMPDQLLLGMLFRVLACKWQILAQVDDPHMHD